MQNAQLSLFEQVVDQRPGLSEAEVVCEISERILTEAQATPPVPVEVIASLRGVASIEERAQPWAGVLEPRDGSLAIAVRAGDGRERQRFTICHETGHTFFPGFTEARQFRCNGARSRTERLCDSAAAELLFPRGHFTSDLQAASFGWDAVEQLSAGYAGSIEATARRLVDLWPEPAMLIVLSMRHKPSETGCEQSCPARLRVDYAHGHGAWPFIKPHKSVSADSVFGRAWAGFDAVSRQDLGDIAAEGCAATDVHARRYGSRARVLALVRRPHLNIS